MAIGAAPSREGEEDRGEGEEDRGEKRRDAGIGMSMCACTGESDGSKGRAYDDDVGMRMRMWGTAMGGKVGVGVRDTIEELKCDGGYERTKN